MEKLIIQLVGTFLRIFLRSWIENENGGEILGDNITDAIQFAENMGLSYFEAKNFRRTIETFTDIISEDFIKKFGTQIESEERRDAILLQIREDIQKINLNETDMISLFSKPSELRVLIMKQSEQERIFWSASENGIYTNCINYVSQIGLDFISKLPDFSPLALKRIIQYQNEYYKDLQEILKSVHAIENSFKYSTVMLEKYDSIYRGKIIEKYGKIELIGSKINNNKCTRFDITTAYVELNCIGNRAMEELKLSRVFEASNVVWIKGEAGAGKTTFLQWVAMCSAKEDSMAIKNIENTIPIVIGLRSIEWPLNLYNIVDNVTSPEGIHCPEGWLKELLDKRNVILLFDGLDEISKGKRNEIYNYVEDFVERHPHAKILLTARNSVKESLNCKNVWYEIAPMRMESIKAFIEYWHKSILYRDASIDREEINSLQHNLMDRIIKNHALKELARNPLLCAMLCALNYVNKEQIPDNKMQLYEECCEMLMDARDSQRKIDVTIYNNVPKLDYISKRRILEEIAFRMMKNGVSSENKQTIIRFLDNLLKDTSIISDVNGNYSIEAILDFLIERSGIIREPEEGVIDFIHKTFMEFLAVDTILRNSDRDILVKEARNINWRETIIMCFSKMSEDDIDYVLGQLVAKGKAQRDDRYFLIASLCASNANFYKCQSPIKKEIDKRIEEMIPPSDDKIEEMAELGLYLLAFLKNSDKYTNEEKYNCLRLLAMSREREAIPIILTYIMRYYDAGGINIYQFALQLLMHYPEEEIEEYNVKEFLVDSMLKYIGEGQIFVYQDVFYILNGYTVPKKEAEQLEKVKTVYIQTQAHREYYYKEYYYKETVLDWGKYFKGCEEVYIMGDIDKLSFLQYFNGIKKLGIETEIHLAVLTNELNRLNNLESIISLELEVKHPEIYLISRLCKRMINLESITITMNNPDMAINPDTFDQFVWLKEVIFKVDENLKKEINESKYLIRGKNKDLNIIVEAKDSI